MLTIVANVLAGLIAASVFFFGVRALFVPQGATGFGIPDTRTQDPTFRSWLSVKGVRDIAVALFIVILIGNGATRLLGWLMLVAVIIPAGDALIVLRSNGPRWAVYGMHGGAATLTLITGVLLLMV